MVLSSCLLYFICVWFPLKTVRAEEKIIEEENMFPLLRHIKVIVSPGIINMTWNCNITESMRNYIYEVILQEKYPETINVTMCSFVFKVHRSMEFIVHKGVSVQLSVNDISGNIFSGKEVTYMPEGKNNSAAENFSCVIYNVSIMNCSWTVGKEAPEDTQYSLVLRQIQRNEYVKCQDYRNDSFGRQVGCVLKRPDIYFNHKVYVEVLGLSNQTSIQFFDELYKPVNHVILDPPRNITLSYKSDELVIEWQKTETHDKEAESCFLYNINITDKDAVTEIIPVSEVNVYKTPKYQPNERVTVTMRVKWQKRCSDYHKWSAWSEQVIGYNSPPLRPHHILIVTGVCTAIIIIGLIFLCYRFRICKKLFPEVPRPSIKLLEQKEKSVPKESEIEIPFMKTDEEECICSHVTEMPEKL